MTTQVISQSGRFGASVYLLVAVFLAGCGESGPKIYPIEGAVTYMGQPVPGGKIRLEPVGDKKDPRASPETAISGGRYKFSGGKGVIGGKYVVYILATDGKAGGEDPYGNPLFSPQYMAEVTLPPEGGTFDFNIPEQSKGKKK